MSKKKDGGPAFPAVLSVAPGVRVMEKALGMSLRDYFASSITEKEIACIVNTLEDAGPNMTLPEALAEIRYRFADAMLAEREREQDDE